MYDRVGPTLGPRRHRDLSVDPAEWQDLVRARFEAAELRYDAERWERAAADLQLHPCVLLPYIMP
jgi:hypothetical protein